MSLIPKPHKFAMMAIVVAVGYDVMVDPGTWELQDYGYVLVLTWALRKLQGKSTLKGVLP
jgi:hypothetical protein